MGISTRTPAIQISFYWHIKTIYKECSDSCIINRTTKCSVSFQAFKVIFLTTIVYFLLGPPGHQTLISVGHTAFAAWRLREWGFQPPSCLSQWLTAMGFLYESLLPVFFFISHLFNIDYIKLGYTATNNGLIVAELI